MRFIDRSGQVFGRLTVLGPANRHRNGRTQWLCRCSCGTEKVFVGHNLLNGDSKSCGCLKIETHSKPVGVAARNRIKKSYKQNARNRGLPWEISDETFDELVSGNCAYCGATPSPIHRDTRYPIPFNGIDRIDSKKGYVDENVVPCCPQCNWAKSDLSVGEFRNWVRAVAEHFFA